MSVMNSEEQRLLETEIDRELKALPHLQAPATLVGRVMRSIEQRATLPWYRQSWQLWPVGVQAAAFLLMAAMFGSLCFGSWKLAQLESMSVAMRQVGGWFAEIGAVWNAVQAVLTALLLVVKQLGTGVLIWCLTALAITYATCIGLGTVYLRLGLARR